MSLSLAPQTEEGQAGPVVGPHQPRLWGEAVVPTTPPTLFGSPCVKFRILHVGIWGVVIGLAPLLPLETWHSGPPVLPPGPLEEWWQGGAAPQLLSYQTPSSGPALLPCPCPMLASARVRRKERMSPPDSTGTSTAWPSSFLSSRAHAPLLQHWPLCCCWGKLPPGHLLPGIGLLFHLLLMDPVHLGLKMVLLYFLHLILLFDDTFPLLLHNHHFLILYIFHLLPFDFRWVHLPLSPPPQIPLSWSQLECSTAPSSGGSSWGSHWFGFVCLRLSSSCLYLRSSLWHKLRVDRHKKLLNTNTNIYTPSSTWRTCWWLLQQLCEPWWWCCLLTPGSHRWSSSRILKSLFLTRREEHTDGCMQVQSKMLPGQLLIYKYTNILVYQYTNIAIYIHHKQDFTQLTTCSQWQLSFWITRSIV